MEKRWRACKEQKHSSFTNQWVLALFFRAQHCLFILTHIFYLCWLRTCCQLFMSCCKQELTIPYRPTLISSVYLCQLIQTCRLWVWEQHLIAQRIFTSSTYLYWCTLMKEVMRPSVIKGWSRRVKYSRKNAIPYIALNCSLFIYTGRNGVQCYAPL